MSAEIVDGELWVMTEGNSFLFAGFCIMEGDTIKYRTRNGDQADLFGEHACTFLVTVGTLVGQRVQMDKTKAIFMRNGASPCYRGAIMRDSNRAYTFRWTLTEQEMR